MYTVLRKARVDSDSIYPASAHAKIIQLQLVNGLSATATAMYSS